MYNRSIILNIDDSKYMSILIKPTGLISPIPDSYSVLNISEIM